MAGFLRRFGLSKPGHVVAGPVGVRWMSAVDLLSSERGQWSSRETRQAFLDDVARQHGLETVTDWKKVSTKDVFAAGGGGLLKRYGGSVFALLRDTLEGGESLHAHECRSSLPKGYWSSQANCRAFMDLVKEKHSVRKDEEWMQVTATMVEEEGGKRLMQLHEGSMRSLLKAVYPEVQLPGLEEEEMKGKNRRPRGYWAERENRETFVKHVGDQLDIQSPKQWGRVSSADIRRLGGTGLLAFYSYSRMAMLQDLLPEAAAVCQPKRQPGGHWHTGTNGRAFMQELAEKHGVKEKADWKRVSYQDVLTAGGSGLLHAHGWSLARVIQEVYYGQEEVSVREVREKLPQGHWQERENCREFLLEMAEERGISSPGEWQAVTQQEVVEAGGSGLLQRYSGSLLAALQDAFGESFTAATCRVHVPESYWKEEANVAEFVRRLEKECGVREEKDWARLSHDEIRCVNGGHSFLKHHSLKRALQQVYPDMKLGDGIGQGAAKKARQRQMCLSLADLFAAQERDRLQA